MQDSSSTDLQNLQQDKIDSQLDTSLKQSMEIIGDEICLLCRLSD